MKISIRPYKELKEGLDFWRKISEEDAELKENVEKFMIYDTLEDEFLRYVSLLAISRALEAIDISKKSNVETGFNICISKDLDYVRITEIAKGERYKVKLPKCENNEEVIGKFHVHTSSPFFMSAVDLLFSVVSADNMFGKVIECIGYLGPCIEGYNLRDGHGASTYLSISCDMCYIDVYLVRSTQKFNKFPYVYLKKCKENCSEEDCVQIFNSINEILMKMDKSFKLKKSGNEEEAYRIEYECNTKLDELMNLKCKDFLLFKKLRSFSLKCGIKEAKELEGAEWSPNYIVKEEIS